MSIFPIFKVNKLSDTNIVDSIYVFYGSQDIDDPNNMFSNDPTNKAFADVFNKDELDYISTNKINVIFVNQSIHTDDSIGVIKLKIFEAIKKKASMSELYLFCLKFEKLNPITIYQNLTQNDKLPLTRIRMNQLLLNLYDDEGNIMTFDLPNKSQYTFDDILKLDLNEKTYYVGKPLGQKFVFSNEYPFIADPFIVTEYDSLLEKSRRETSTLSANLLLETGDIFRNTIYLCLATDVFEIAQKNDISTEYTSKIYFPFLYQDQIETLEKLNTNRNKLITTTIEKLNPDTERNFNNINMFYNINKNHNTSNIFSQNVNQTGIKFLKIAIYPEFKIKIPIDVIFKLIHATEACPLIKYNPEFKQENIYRLFAPELTNDGRKIPYLQKAVIFKLMRLIGKNRSVAVYTNIKYKNVSFFMSCEFEDNGVIIVYPLLDFDNPIFLTNSQNKFENIDEIIRSTVNPLIEQIKPFFEQSGLDIPLFESIKSINVEVRDMKYQTVYNIAKSIDINKLSGCVSSVFTIESSNFKKGIRMRYKRVSNFNKRESQEAFIIEKIDQGYKIDEIIEQLLQQFDDLDQEAAEDLISKIRSELEVIRGANKRRALMIKINPGFQTLMNANLITSELTIDVSGINDIYYLNTIPIYIDSIVRITQDIDSCGIDKSKINTLCSGEEIEDIEFGEITAQSEQSLDDNEVPIIQNESPVYEEEKGEYMDDLLDILAFDEDESPELKGGNESDSEEELSSLELSSKKSSNSSKSSLSSKSSPELEVVQESPEKKSEDSSINLDDISDLESLKSPTPESIPKISSPEVLSESSSSKSSPEVSSESSSESVKKISSPEVLSESSSESSSESVKKISSPEVSSDKLSSSKSSSESVKKISSPEVLSESSSESSSKSSPEVSSESSSSKSSSKSSPEILSDKLPTPKSLTPDESSELLELIKKSTPKKVEKQVQKKIKKQAQNLENTVRDITGMKLQYPNPFSSRLEERMPNLFVKSKNEKIDLYSRMCPFTLSERRQPIILTKEERDKIVQEHPGEIDEEADFIEYGTDSKDSSKKFYYTCPKYWCLLTDTMVTEQDILDGKCGPKVTDIKDAIIPKQSDTVPKGKYVYQFYDKNQKKYPGFHKQKTSSGLCIPCCYSNWKTPEIKNRRDICQGKFDEKKSEKVSKEEEDIEQEIRKNITEIETYVKGPEKYGPQLGEHRWGFLPIAVQKFLHEVNGDCQVSETNMSLKLNHTCILRHGVEVSSSQSFIACIASAIFYAQKYKDANNSDIPLIKKFISDAKFDVPTIKEMKQILIKSINLDSFIKYQNGDLITSFANPDLDVNIENYGDTKLYKKMVSLKKKIKNDNTEEFIIKVVQAFENFKNFLNDDKITIDYTYLWDLICMPNPYIFEEGINLIVLEIPEDDITNNIELVCPTNHYSVNVYDTRKRSLILIKRETYFEPIYAYLNDGKVTNITKTFSEYNKKLPKTLRAVFSKIIKPTLGEKCKTFMSRPNEYRFNKAPELDKLIEILNYKGYTITFQVLNFQGKVIGVFAKHNKDNLEGFIPCYPSALTNLKKRKCQEQKNNEEKDEEKESTKNCEYDFVYMNDDIWKPYEQTLKFLKKYYDYEEPTDIMKANCFDPKYFCRVVENEHITGFLTNTDQFVPINPPVPVSTVDDTIKTLTRNDTLVADIADINTPLVADINTLVNNKVDVKRVDFIKRIQLETNFYNVFRNTIRILFNDYLNSQKRKAIKDECNKRFSIYKNQLDTVIELLQDLVQDTIVFASESKMPYNYIDINEKDLHTCISQPIDKCLSKGSICRITNDKCQLVLPKFNLVNETDNEEFYYGRMADELIRYNRIKSFIFKPQSYLSFGQVKYNLRDDEIIILQDLLTQEFFENLIPSEINSYAKYNTYDTAKPILSQTYNREKELNDTINPFHNRDCAKSEANKIKSEYWRNCFPDNFKEIEYSGSNYCSLYLIIDLVKEIKKQDLNVEKVKDDLVDIYSNLTSNFKDKNRINTIINILREEAQFDADQLQDGTITFEQMILQDGFIGINFDLWLLLVHYKIPSIFISSKLIPETRFNAKEFVCYKEDNINKYVFILTPAMYRREINVLPKYKIIVDNEKININLDKLNQENCFDEIDTAFKKYITIEDYLDVQFYVPRTTKYTKREKNERPPVEFEINEEVKEGEEPKATIKNQKPNKKKLKTFIILEEEEDPEEFKKGIEEGLFPEEQLDFEPKPKEKLKKKTKKHKIKVNPPGKKGTRKKTEVNFEISEQSEEIV